MTTEAILLNEKARTGKKLLRFAWATEIVAASVGLGIALMMIVGTGENGESEGVLAILANKFVMAGPFVLIAIIELAKIPLATTAYHAKNKFTKLIFALGLMVVVGITFETIFNGLERFFTATSFSVETERSEKASLELKIREIKQDLDNGPSISDNSIEISRAEKTKAVEDSYQRQIDEVRAEINSLTARRDSLTSATSEAVTQQILLIQTNLESLRETYRQDPELEQLSERERMLRQNAETDQDRLENRYRDDLDRISKNLVLEQEEIRMDIRRLEKEIGGISPTFQKKRYTELDAEITALKESLESLQANYAVQITAIEREYSERLRAIELGLKDSINQVSVHRRELTDTFNAEDARLRAELKALRLQQSQKLSQSSLTDQSGDPTVLALTSSLRELIANRDGALQELRLGFAKEDQALLKKSEMYERKKEALEQLQDEVIQRERNMEAAIFGNGGQVYRWTKRLFGKEHVSEVTADEVGLVAAVWFGSIAFIVAFIGPFLAFGSHVLTYGPNTRRSGLASRSMRRFFVNARRRQGRVKTVEVEKVVEIEKEVPVERLVTKEVVKEVPVERLVTKEVVKEVPVDRVVFKEVPKEIIKREYVYVPVGQDPSDISNLVQTAAA